MRETKPKARAGAAVGIALLALTALSGCRQPHNGGSQDVQAATAAPSGDAASSGEIAVLEQPTLPPPSSVANDQEKRKQVAIGTCEATKDGWRAAGTAVNPGGRDADYRIVVYFTSAKATVLALGDTAVNVKAGQSGAWEVLQAFHAPQGTLCVLRGVS
ncbi:hypothetical protein ACFWNL_39075 [Kitasatospora sp. NPDC058397]|uniref:hypothetical protein n=1 Tax=unclassified Kitasatospora TaxID=2633591 RepID=UPI00365E9BB5